MSDEQQLVDHKVAAEQLVKEKCMKEHEEYNKCIARITGPDGKYIKGKHCAGYALEYWRCVDVNAPKEYFSKLV